MHLYTKNWFKFIFGFLVCLIVRFIPFRPPNIEPILAVQIPFSRAYGALVGFLFAFFNIILFDLFTGYLGVWSLLTAGTYGILGIFAAFYFRKEKIHIWHYAYFAVFGTLFFDGVTGLSIGPLFFNQPFAEAFWGQIPFTLWHLLGNVSFSLILSPAIYRYVIRNEQFDHVFLTNLLWFKKNKLYGK